ncbi:hypothetical protein L9F63_027755, partial [Diploptera punctata]
TSTRTIGKQCSELFLTWFIQMLEKINWFYVYYTICWKQSELLDNHHSEAIILVIQKYEPGKVGNFNADAPSVIIPFSAVQYLCTLLFTSDNIRALCRLFSFQYGICSNFETRISYMVKRMAGHNMPVFNVLVLLQASRHIVLLPPLVRFFLRVWSIQRHILLIFAPALSHNTSFLTTSVFILNHLDYLLFLFQRIFLHFVSLMLSLHIFSSMRKNTD